MTTELIVIFLALALVSEILGTIGGFGSSVFFVPLAAMFMEFREVLGLTAIFHVASNLSKIALFRKGIDKRLILLLGIPAIIAVIIGAYITRFLDSERLELALGVLLVAMSLFFLLRPAVKVTPTAPNAALGGLLSGGVAGVLGTGGAIRGLTLTAFSLSKDAFVATSAFIDLGVDFSRSIVYASSGYLTGQTLALIPFLVVIGFLGTYLGKKILNRISQERFKKIALVLILGIGVSILMKG